MANHKRGEVELDVNGAPRTLRFDMGALAESSSRLGLKRMSEFIDVIQDPSPNQLQVLLWAGLRHADRRLRLEALDSWSIKFLPAVMAVQRAVMLALNGGEEEAGDEEAMEAPAQDHPL